MRPPRHVLPWLFLLSFGVAPMARADGLVLSSTAPGVAVGQLVADGDTLRLPAHSLTVVLLSTGQVVKLAGPYEGNVTAGGPDDKAAGKTVVLSDWRSADPSSGAAGGQASPASPALDAGAAVVVDGTRSGTWCLTPHSRLRLAAPSARPSAVELREQDGGARAIVAWPPANGDQPWPAALAPRDGATVLARWGQSELSHALQFRVLPADDQSSSSRLIAWWRAGCRQQVEPILQDLAAEAAPFALFLTTDRGHTPRYALGQPLNVVVQANRAAFLYCFVVQDGRVRPIFSGLSGEPGRMALPDQTALQLTAERLPLDAAAPPPRLAELRCYAVTPDGAPSIAATWGAVGQRPDLSPAALDRVFEALPEAQVAQARVIVRAD